jgi:hypothetical protein
VSIARRDPADDIKADFFRGAGQSVRLTDDPESIRASGPGAAITVARECAAMWLQPDRTASAGGRNLISTIAEFVVDGSAAAGRSVSSRHRLAGGRTRRRASTWRPTHSDPPGLTRAPWRSGSRPTPGRRPASARPRL